ncbi:MAG TPA: amidase [Solirubrobacteraceae bacterium]
MAAELMFKPVDELAALVRDGSIGARELAERSLERIEALDPQLGAFIQVDRDGALEAADAIAPGDPRPFAGVPIAIKNNRAVAGLRLTHGCKLMRDFIAPYDHNAVARLRAAGFVIVGTTKPPEYGILPVTEPLEYGPCRNPWDPTLTPGGSSGGSAAAVAAGMVPIAHGNDGGGSLRIPAACCGLVGLKPTRHRVSTAPDLGASQLVIDGVLTRTVGETAALLDILAGYVTGDAAIAPAPAEPFAQTAARAPTGLRVAFTLKPPIADAEIDPLCAAAVRQAATLAEALGHRVEEFDPPWQAGGLVERFLDYFAVHVAVGIRSSAVAAGRTAPMRSDVEPLSWALFQRASQIGAVDYQLSETQLHFAMRALVTSLAPYDILLTPALAKRPLPLGSLDTASPHGWETFRRSGYFTPFTAIFNLSGLPALSLPLFDGDDGLPLGVQLVGRPAGDGDLLAFAAALEAAGPPRSARPKVS